tara:strand:+ start:526 stop:825 length:300 start_codon:yes stop_codon:yes gene_type:complete
MDIKSVVSDLENIEVSALELAEGNISPAGLNSDLGDIADSANALKVSLIKKPDDKTPAQKLLFQLQWLGVMGMAGREDEADAAYVKAQKLAQQLVDAGH